MQVLKYKKKRDGKYLVSFSNGKEMEMYEEVILKYELLLKKEIDAKKILDIIAYNQECDVYYVALKYMKARLRSRLEVFDMLKRREYPLELIDKALNRLTEQGYLNDLNYASSFLHNQIITTSRGPKRVSYELEKKGISKEIIQEVMGAYNAEIELEKIEKIVRRMIASNRNKGNLLLKRKIEQELLHQGFHKQNIYTVLDSADFSDDKVLYQKEYDKLYRKLSKKYSGDALTFQIKQKLYQKGFRYED